MTEKKIEIFKRNIKKYKDFIRCPLCGSIFDMADMAGMTESTYSSFLKCRSNHTYDISKKGYVNLFNGQTKITKTYDKHLFSARKIISDSGFYGLLTQKLFDVLNINNINHAAILDAGCGCGNLTYDIFKRIYDAEDTEQNPIFAIDLSKDGIDFAAGNFCGDNLLWIVGNLNNLPLSDNKFGVILNIMSPANYSEFKRILKQDGILIKVLSDSDYLKELRRFIYKENDKNEYSNKAVLTHLEENAKDLSIDIMDIIDLKYVHAVKKSDIPALFDMTPLTLNIHGREQVKDKLIASLNETNDFEVTLAFKIAVCKKL